MADVLEYVYNSRNNTIDLLLKADGAAVDLSSVTRMVVEDVAGDWSVDESTTPAAFARSLTVTGKVVISLGAQSLTAGKYACRLIVYDPANTSGIVWGDPDDQFIINVVDTE